MKNNTESIFWPLQPTTNQLRGVRIDIAEGADLYEVVGVATGFLAASLHVEQTGDGVLVVFGNSERGPECLGVVVTAKVPVVAVDTDDDDEWDRVRVRFDDDDGDTRDDSVEWGF